MSARSEIGQVQHNCELVILDMIKLFISFKRKIIMAVKKNCLVERCAWFHPIHVAIVTALSIVSFIVVFVIWHNTTFSTTQNVYTTSGMLSNFPQNHVLSAAVPLAMTLPNNMLEFIGAEYTIDCPTPVAHSVTIQAGTLTTTWDGVNRKVTCTGPRVGLSFRVISSSVVRVTSPSSAGVVYSL